MGSNLHPKRTTIEDFETAPVEMLIGKTKVLEIIYGIESFEFEPRGMISKINDTWGYARKGWKQMKILFCPKCLRSIIVGRDSLADGYTYNPEQSWIELTNGYRFAPREFISYSKFNNHLPLCHRTFHSGFPDLVLTEKNKQLMVKLSWFSKLAQHYTVDHITEEMFQQGLKVFSFSNEDCYEGYIAFKPARYRLDNKLIITHALWDLYVLPEFRNKGLGTKLLEEGLHSLRISPEDFTIYGPMSTMALNIILRQAKESFVVLWGSGPSRINKESFLKLIKDIL